MVKVAKYDMARVFNTNTENRKKYVGYIEEFHARIMDFQHAMFTDLALARFALAYGLFTPRSSVADVAREPCMAPADLLGRVTARAT
ncbi:hypothetical protein NFJ02_21g44910 [Pycnococcus provasolii]